MFLPIFWLHRQLECASSLSLSLFLYHSLPASLFPFFSIKLCSFKYCIRRGLKRNANHTKETNRKTAIAERLVDVVAIDTINLIFHCVIEMYKWIFSLPFQFPSICYYTLEIWFQLPVSTLIFLRFSTTIQLCKVYLLTFTHFLCHTSRLRVKDTSRRRTQCDFQCPGAYKLFHTVYYVFGTVSHNLLYVPSLKPHSIYFCKYKIKQLHILHDSQRCIIFC